MEISPSGTRCSTGTIDHRARIAQPCRLFCALATSLLLLLTSPVFGQESTTGTPPPETTSETAPVQEAGAEGAAEEPEAEEPEEKKTKKKKKKRKKDRLRFKEKEAAIASLPQKYAEWVRDVELIISDPELRLFVELEKDYQRDAFIEEFWKVRDPYPRSTRNEFRESYYERLRYVKANFPGQYDERATILLTNGPPAARLPINCKPYLSPLEVWYYDGSDTVGHEFLLLFYQRWGSGPFRLWQPFDGVNELAMEGEAVTPNGIENRCGFDKAEAILAAIGFLNSQGSLGAGVLLSKIQEVPEPPKKEWVATFATYTTELPDGVGTFEAELLVDYPGRKQSRTVAQGTVAVNTDQIRPVVLAGGLSRSFNLVLVGEILKDGTLFDTFRYQYDFPAPGQAEGAGEAAVETSGEIGSNEDGTGESSGGTGSPGNASEATPTSLLEVPMRLPLVFQRYLRPGTYELMVRIEDLGSGAYNRSTMTLDVPKIESAPPPPMDPETARVLEEANRMIRSGETSVRIQPLSGEWQTGLVRIDALTLGPNIDHVTFFLDDRPVLTKKSPPFNVELDLGNVPRARVLRVQAYDEADEILASDELMINSGDHRFDIRLEEPRPGRTYRQSLRAEANLVIPKGEVVERVEFYVDDTKVSTLYQPPWIQPIVLPEEGAIAYVRAAAYTPSGAMVEDLVFVNAPDNLEEIDVEFVELYTLALDRDNRPAEGLVETDFSVFEDGVPQDLVRFELVQNLPIHAAILLDVSASMDERLVQTRDAALRFFEQAVTPKDRATTITFNDHPALTVDFTNDLAKLAGGLANIKAERGTALYDAIVFALYYFNGIKGQRAILLLSDGRDESSRFDFDDTLEYARRAGVSIYTIGLGIPRSHLDARRNLNKLAADTGGRSFYLEEVAELDAVYDTIQRELRSRYLLAYQSSNSTGSDAFRTIEVEIARPGTEAKTLRGYYP